MKRSLSVIFVIILLCVGLFTCAEAQNENLGKQKSEWYGRRDFMWPVPNKHNISSCFFDYSGHQGGHYAIDIAANSKVVASYAGTVYWIKKESESGGFGNSVMIKHEGYTTFWGKKVTLYTHYAHLESISKDIKVNKPVSKGQKIGVAGNTGNSFGNHLDFMILTKPNVSISSRTQNSLDPYANFLLELPRGLTKGGSTACCTSYIKAIKALYADYSPVRIYTDKCKFYKADGIITITQKTTIKSFPCSRDTNNQSTDVKTAKKNERYKVVGVYKNTAGNYWYQIMGQVNSSGYPTGGPVAGYIYAGSAAPALKGWKGYYYLPNGTFKYQ